FAVRYHARDVDVWGPFADRITLEDIQQIRNRIATRGDIRLPVSTIHRLTENSAEVTSGIPWDMEKPFSYHMFIMRRQYALTKSRRYQPEFRLGTLLPSWCVYMSQRLA